MTVLKVILWVIIGIIVVIGVVAAIFFATYEDPFVAEYRTQCATCHGEELEGTALGPALIGRELTHGDSVAEIMQSITNGFPQRGMPAWGDTLDDGRVQSLAIYVAERRVDRRFMDFKVYNELALPEDDIETEAHTFRVETVAQGLDALPLSLAPLPDGRFLVTEKTKGLRIVEADGTLSEYVTGTPQAHDDTFEMNQLEYGLGWLMDVALHPDYEENGWIYLHYGDRCESCKGDSFLPVSMNKVIRGRIRDGAWVDEEVIWQTAPENYTPTPDMAAGGRLCFDGEGSLFISIGMKGPSNYQGIQDLSMPYGKIHRVRDDGSIPTDNPFIHQPDVVPSTWTYGHRSPQGLEFDPVSGALWGTEMGPRGGDELNLLRPGRNFGWPLYSKGLNYDGTPVNYGVYLGIEFDLEDIEQPVLDLTPSPAISSFIFYEGASFPGWQHNILVGSLKATELYRFVIDRDKVVHQETLLKDFARIRDIETGPDGDVYLLLEHSSGGRIVRLTPAIADAVAKR